MIGTLALRSATVLEVEMMLASEVEVVLVCCYSSFVLFFLSVQAATRTSLEPDYFLTLSFFTLSSSRPPRGPLFCSRKNLKATPNPTFPVAANLKVLAKWK